jgi:hypothetical protein
MIKVSVFYPDRDGARFDMRYYCERHIPMVLTPGIARMRRISSKADPPSTQGGVAP